MISIRVQGVRGESLTFVAIQLHWGGKAFETGNFKGIRGLIKLYYSPRRMNRQLHNHWGSTRESYVRVKCGQRPN